MHKTLLPVEEILPDKQRVLEIGSGVGRLALPHVQAFQEMITVDISPTMLAKLEKNAQKNDLQNIKTLSRQ